jgi:5-methylcytosine-specific restriction enzyme A
MAQYRHRRITGPRWQHIVAMIVVRDGGICHICGGLGATSADHVVPLADGGSNWPQNLRAAHAHCNYAKNARRTTGFATTRRTARARRAEYPGAINLRATP